MTPLQIKASVSLILFLLISRYYIKGATDFIGQKRTFYHIIQIAPGDIYTVASSGVCLAGTGACSFYTELPPDQPSGRYSRTYLLDNGVLIYSGQMFP